MKTPLALAAVLLVGASAGAALASTSDVVRHFTHGMSDAVGRADDDGRATFRIAGDHRRDRDGDHHGRRSHRDHDDDDDDDGAAGRGGRMPAAGPSDPTTPVPDNGLFQGKARPKVEVN
ncbi:MAG: hypothetical protein LWW93_05315 [Hyphomicrobiales bacterium]|nr:hypothetical protein [Hyphomicrobiales bacterium]